MNNILFLSPMPSLAEIAEEIAEELGIHLIVESTDDPGVEHHIRKHPDIEVVVARGGMAEIAKRVPGISVVEIAMSLNELLGKASTLSAKGCKRIGIVSRSNLLGGAFGNFQIDNTLISIYPQADEESIQGKVKSLAGEGFTAFIGCRAAYATAQKLGIEAAFIESGRTSIKTALNEATRILQAKNREKLQAAQLTAIIDNIDEAVIAYAPERQVNFFNRHAARLCTTPPSKQPNFSDVHALLDTGDREQIASVCGNHVLARVIPLELGDCRDKIITLREIAKIQASESTIRSSFYKKGLFARYHFKDVIGDSAAMKTLTARAKLYAAHDSNLLISGETGTGKEVFAQSIHNHSHRKHGPFVSVNIASIAPSLLESELFGYAEGAFTGARKGGKPGLFELAHGGTLFLDEIGELAPEMQSRLLRVLQEREIMRIGDDKIIPVDVRIISATNRDLYQQTLAGLFRQDLFYRINVVSLRIPSLRERTDDIPLLFIHYLQRFASTGRTRPRLSTGAKQLIKARPWPGNIRQLRNLAEVISYEKPDLIDTTHLAAALGNQDEEITASGHLIIRDGGSLKAMESEIIRNLLARKSANAVCTQLGISRVTLWRKLQSEAGLLKNQPKAPKTQ